MISLKSKLLGLLVVCLAFLTLTTSTANAQPNLKSLFEQSTFAYARADLENLDFEALNSIVGNFFQSDAQAKADAEKFFVQAKMVQEQLKLAGATEVVATISLDDLPLGGPSIFVACPASEENRNSLRELGLNLGGPSYTSLDVDGGIIFCSTLVKDRLTNVTNSRNVSEAVLSGHNNAPLAFVLCPSPDQRKVLREIMTTLPVPFQDFSGRELADGGTVMSVQISPKNDKLLTLSCQGVDEEQNRKLAGTMKTFIGKLAKGEVKIPNVEMPVVMDVLGGAIDEVDLSGLDNAKDGRFEIAFKKSDGSFAKLVDSFKGPIAQLRQSARRQQLDNNLKQVILAAHNVHDATRSFPGLAITDETGKPLLSWRVAILPFIEQGELYKQFKLDEPWDSEHNKKLLPMMPEIYVSGFGEVAGEFKTNIQFPEGPETIGQPKGIRIRDIIDGTSNTILVLRTNKANAVPWTKPADWKFDSADPLRGLAEEGQTTLTFGMADGSLQQMNIDKVDWIRKSMTYEGKDIVQDDK